MREADIESVSLVTYSNWAITDRQELIDIVEVVYRGASKGRGLVISPKGKSSSAHSFCRSDQRKCVYPLTLEPF